MRKIWQWVKYNPNRTMFLIPILLVAGISISHVVSWYDIANPFNWAVYLSIAIEVGAMTALIAATNKIKGGVWFMFGLVTLIQFIGNIFYSYKEIDPNSDSFKMWVELTGPIWEMVGTEQTDIIGLKRWLAILEGGLLPIISLTSLHFFVKYEKPEDKTNSPKTEENSPKTEENVSDTTENDKTNSPKIEEDSPKLKYNPNIFQGVSSESNEGGYEQMGDGKDSFIFEEETDHALIEEDNPEDELIIPQKEQVIKQEMETVRIPPRMVNDDFSKTTPGEELNQTWRNIVRRRRGNNGIERV